MAAHEISMLAQQLCPHPWRSLLLVTECGLNLLPAVGQVLHTVDVGHVLEGVGVQEVAQVGAVVYKEWSGAQGSEGVVVIRCTAGGPGDRARR